MTRVETTELAEAGREGAVQGETGSVADLAEVPAQSAATASKPVANECATESRPLNGAGLTKAREKIAETLNLAFKVFGVLIPLLIVGMMALLGFGGQTIDRIALVGSLQVGLGMLFGFLCLYFGFMITWVGIEAAFDFSTSVKQSQVVEGAVAIKGASPGLLFGLAGVGLIAACLYKELRYEERPYGPVVVDSKPPNWSPPPDAGDFKEIPPKCSGRAPDGGSSKNVEGAPQ